MSATAQFIRQRGCGVDFGAVGLLACPVLLWVFNQIAVPTDPSLFRVTSVMSGQQ